MRGAGPTVRDAAYPESAIISNGTIELGINPTGNLNVGGGTPSSGTGTTAVGLRYVPTNADSTSPGCLCEGWGVADAGGPGDPNTGTTGYANVSSDHGSHHLQVVEFENSTEEARSVVDVLGGDEHQVPIIRVTHEFRPFAGSPNLYEAAVTVENLTGTPLNDLRYRRVMDWDIEPTAFQEYSTIDGDRSSQYLEFSSDDGFASANPLSSRSLILAEGFFTDSGPADHGALFDFGFGALSPLESKSFRIFYGAAGTETDALAAVTAAQAEVWSLGEPTTPGGPTLGTPNTFIFGFTGIGGAGAGTDERPPVNLVTAAPSRLPVGGRELEVTARLDNTSNTGIADGSVRIDPGPDLSLVEGDSPHALGTLPTESAGHGPTASWKLNTPPPDCGVDHTYEYDVYGDFAGSGSAGGERHVHRSVVVPHTCGTIDGFTNWEKLEGTEVLFSGPEPNAQIFVCPLSGGGCRSITSGPDGNFRIDELPSGDYTVEARPDPSGAHVDLPPQTKILHLVPGGAITQNFTFSKLRKPPGDGSSSATTPGIGGATEDGYPLIYWNDPIHLVTKTEACPHPKVSYTITQGDPIMVTLASGSMTEGPVGTFTADAPAVYPHHGYARVTFTVDCSGSPDPEPVSFDVYIDPSGLVKTVDGAPIPEAKVTLLRSDKSTGPFAPVPDGSTLMSPTNRRNPDFTDSAGHFGWNVSAGFYKVQAEKNGCHAPGNSSAVRVESPVFAVPPPVTDIDLRLECSSPAGGGAPPPKLSRHGIAIAGAVALVKGGKAMLRLSCSGGDPCDGDARLTASAPKRSQAGKHAARAAAVVIGRKGFHLEARASALLAITLTAKGKQMLRKAGRRGLEVKLTGEGVTGRKVTLRESTRKRHGKKR
jgi:hypothetical protein